MLTFDLDICPKSVDALLDILQSITTNGGHLSGCTPVGPGGGNPNILITAPSQANAYAIIDAIYGPENDSRESNHFHVYGE